MLNSENHLGIEFWQFLFSRKINALLLISVITISTGTLIKGKMKILIKNLNVHSSILGV